MLAAVLYGTAKQSYDPYGEQALGKTGTCNDEDLGGRLGWFASYADQAHPKIVLVVLLHGRSRIISGPHASEIAGPHLPQSLPAQLFRRRQFKSILIGKLLRRPLPLASFRLSPTSACAGFPFACHLDRA